MLKRALMLVVLIGAVGGCSGTQTRASGPVVPAIPDNSATAGCDLPEAGADGWVDLRPECAAQVSRRSPRPLLLYFFTEWCGPCKDLDQRTFPDGAVRGFLTTRVVAVKVDCAPGPGKDLAESLGVNSYPTMVLLDPQGVEIERLFGFLTPQDFLRTLGDYLEGRNTAADLLRQANAAPENLALQFKAGRDLAIRGRTKDAEPLLLRVTTAATAPELERLSASYLLAKTVYLDGFKQPDKAMPLLEVLIRDHMQTWQGREAFFAKATILVQAGQREEAARLLTTVVDYQQKDPVVFQRLAGFCIQYQVGMEFAEEQAGLLVKQHPLMDWIWKTRAELRFHSGDLKGAQEDLEHALSLAPENGPYKALLEVVRKRREGVPPR
jgi:thioredoxin-like negative regulator of GroEL